MTYEEKQKRAKEPVKVVITRSCRTRVNADSKIQDFAVGAEVTITREFADELISVGKAVIADSPQHIKWVADEKKKEKSRKELAPKTISTAEKIDELIAAIKEFTAAVAESAKKK